MIEAYFQDFEIKIGLLYCAKLNPLVYENS